MRDQDLDGFGPVGTNGPQCSWDERRGIHLLSPGDVVRYEGDFWEVTGVFLATERRASAVTLQAPWDHSATELRLPLGLIEGACEVYLRASRKPLPIVQ